MKTAILLSGHMRSFERCLPTIHWHIARHFPGADWFVSTVKDEDSPKAELLRVKYPNARVETEVVDEQPDCVADMRAKGVNLPAEWIKGKPYTHEPYNISVHPQAVLRQLWQLEVCWELFRSKVDAEDYDVVIRCRPDLWFHSLKRDTSGIWATPYYAYTPYWGQFGGVNDRFAILGTKAAPYYFTTYSKIPKLVAEGCPLHPESLIAASINSAPNIENSSSLFAEFSTLRSNGEMRGPEISTIDLARLHA